MVLRFLASGRCPRLSQEDADAQLGHEELSGCFTFTEKQCSRSETTND